MARIEQTPRGWVASGNGLASRADTREAAIRRHEETVALVRKLAARWQPPREA